MKNNSFIKGASVLAISTFLAKLIGAMYRVPFTNALGGVGLGLYQMVFPVYCILLDFAGSGVPSALSRLISGKNDLSYSQTILKTSVRLLLVLGMIGTLFMCLLSYPLSILQGNKNAYIGYIFLSPAVFFVSLISCYRGYFQGKMKMTPTAVSQIIEQIVKAVLGVLLVYLLKSNISLAVGGATFAVTISEFIAFLYLYVLYKREQNKNMIEVIYNKEIFKSQAKMIIKNTLPITLIGISIPLSQLIDSFVIVNLLKTYRLDATSLFGLLSGTAMTIINLPVAICYGISVVTIPTISSEGNKKRQKTATKKSISLTILVSLIFAVIVYFLAEFLVRILFNGLTTSEKNITLNLIKILSPAIILLSLLQTQNAVLIGSGKLYLPLISMGLGVLVKTVVSIILLQNQNLNIYGGAIGVITCYLVAVLVNFILIKRIGNNNEAVKTYNRECANFQ